jgi:hypothetical protein
VQCAIKRDVMTAWGQSLPKWTVRVTSAFPPIATIEQTSRHVSNVTSEDLPHT